MSKKDPKDSIDTKPEGRHEAKADPENSSKKKGRLAGVAIVLLLALLAGLFLGFLSATKMLPLKYLALIGLLLLAPILVVAALVRDTEKRGLFWSGVVLALLMAVLLAIGLGAVKQILSTLNAITSPTNERAHISLFVAEEDPAQSLEDVRGYSFGILSRLDRDNTDTAVAEINRRLETQIVLKEYNGLPELVDALLTGETGAILLDSSYLDVLVEVAGYEEVYARLRELDVLSIESSAPVQTASDAWENDGVLTVYISGIDSRRGFVARSLSDVNILATVNTVTHQVLLVSTPRDFYVPLSISNGELDKLTHAGTYGVEVSMDTLGMLYDIDIDYYFKVSFEGFKQIIDSLGGVDVNSEFAFTSHLTEGYSFSQGMNHLNGDRALAFARERKAFATGDRQRGKNQMAVIRAVIEKLQSPEVLANYSGLLQAAEGSFETSVPYDLIAELVRGQLNDGGSWNVVTYSANGSGDSRKTYTQGAYAYVMIPDESTVETAKELMRQVRAGQTVTEP